MVMKDYIKWIGGFSFLIYLSFVGQSYVSVGMKTSFFYSQFTNSCWCVQEQEVGYLQKLCTEILTKRDLHLED